MDNTNADFNSVMEFIVAIDGLKNIFRQTKIVGKARFENDAEHSWHICVMAYSLKDFFDGYEVNVARAVKMLLIHDIVELYAGDTYCYNQEAHADKLDRELAAAKKIFGLLPERLGNELMSLWLEFDREETADAVFASIMDKIQPLILNYHNEGESWKENGISRSQVERRMAIALKEGPAVLKDYIAGIIDESVKNGWLVDQ